MRLVIQRVRRGQVSVEGAVIGKCGKGFVILVGVKQGDTETDSNYLIGKAVNLRVFEDAEGKMNLSALDLQPRGEMLVISQFTLYADTQKGRRPSFLNAAPPPIAEPLVQHFIDGLRNNGLQVETGQFGTEMLVEIENDGPVTIIIDSAEKR